LTVLVVEPALTEAAPEREKWVVPTTVRAVPVVEEAFTPTPEFELPSIPVPEPENPDTPLPVLT
jgi:hypothetical protein